MRILIALFVTAFTVLAMASPNNAAMPPVESSPVAQDYELVVFERRRACVICLLFRRDVAEPYWQSLRNRTAPMRFVDLDTLDLGTTGLPHPGLRSPLKMLPTTVIMRSGRELARVEGYTGPSVFHQSIRAVIRAIPHQTP